MKLRKCLEITKTKEFTVFIYPRGYVEENRGITETTIAQFDVKRDEQGKIPQLSELDKYENAKVTEIIPSSYQVNIVAEVK